MEGAIPARLVEEVDQDVAHEADAFANSLLFDLIGWRFERPVDEHGAADDVFAGNETPEAAVEAFGAVISMAKTLPGGTTRSSP